MKILSLGLGALRVQGWIVTITGLPADVNLKSMKDYYYSKIIGHP